MDKHFIIFDLDGLLIDSETLYQKATFELCARFGKAPNEEVFKKVIGRKLQESMRIYVEMMDLPISPQEMFTLMKDYMKNEIRSNLSLMPGAIEILDTFYNSFPLALATGSSQEILDVVFERTNIAHYFDVIQSSDEIKNGKPNPEIFLLTMHKLRARPEQCIILEDAENGVIAANKSGAYVVAVPNRFTATYDFSKANIIVNNLFDAATHISDIVR